MAETETVKPKATKAPKPAEPTKKATEKKVAIKGADKATHDGTAVGYEAKCLTDCKWNATRVTFYKVLRKIGGSGTAKEIAAASKGEISVGNCLHYGYHGKTPGYNKVEKHEEGTGFVFTLTAKGKSMDLEKMLEKK